MRSTAICAARACPSKKSGYDNFCSEANNYGQRICPRNYYSPNVLSSLNEMKYRLLNLCAGCDEAVNLSCCRQFYAVEIHRLFHKTVENLAGQLLWRTM